MKVRIGQQYVAVGVDFPFSHVMQRWLSIELTSMVDGSHADFLRRYGRDYDLIIYISARRGIEATQVKGPELDKDVKNVEYAAFLPFDTVGDCLGAVHQLLGGVRQVFVLEGLSCERLDAERDRLARQICAEPEMLKGPWPKKGGSKPTD